MAMVYSSIFSPNFISLLPSINPIKIITSSHSCFPSRSIQYYNSIKTSKRELLLPKVASIPFPPINVDYLETEFSGHGVSFERIGESCVVRMGMENGSVASVLLPSGLITSYKATMWHGGLLELLHTLVSEGEDDGDAVIQGGISLALTCKGQDAENGSFSWSPTTWALSSVGGSPEESIQVELISRCSEGMVEVKHIVTLQEDTISSEVIVSNLRTSSLSIMGLIASHLAVSDPEATFALGLARSDYLKKRPVFSNFSIIPPDSNKEDSGLGNLWGSMVFKELFSWGSTSQTSAGNAESKKNEKENEEMEGEEDDNFKSLTEKLSIIYTSAPRNFQVLDRGKRNSIYVGREGFDELYIFSPGSSHESYGKYSYVCVGQAALLKPVIIGPEAEWRGVQHLQNPNL